MFTGSPLAAPLNIKLIRFQKQENTHACSRKHTPAKKAK